MTEEFLKKKLSVLIVEDDISHAVLIQTVVGNIFPNSGPTCQLATSAEEAINRIGECNKHEHPFDIIFLDLHLPQMDGVDLCEIIRGKTEKMVRPDLNLCMESWIIACTMDTKPQTIRAMLRVGADDFLPKPIRPDSIAARLIVAERQIIKRSYMRRFEAIAN